MPSEPTRRSCFLSTAQLLNHSTSDWSLACQAVASSRADSLFDVECWALSAYSRRLSELDVFCRSCFYFGLPTSTFSSCADMFFRLFAWRLNSNAGRLNSFARQMNSFSQRIRPFSRRLPPNFHATSGRALFSFFHHATG
jgi:hypothetical protein